jgi:hypothetical protein
MVPTAITVRFGDVCADTASGKNKHAAKKIIEKVLRSCKTVPPVFQA